jgi:hypothetical protein
MRGAVFILSLLLFFVAAQELSISYAQRGVREDPDKYKNVTELSRFSFFLTLTVQLQRLDTPTNNITCRQRTDLFFLFNELQMEETEKDKMDPRR